MHGNGRSLACRSGDWSGMHWFGRRCQRARLQLERALRAHPSRLRAGLGGGALMASATAGAAATPAPDGGGTPEVKRVKTLADFGHPGRRTTDVFLALNAIVFALNWLSRDVLLLWGFKVNSLIASGQVWRLVTPLFLHSNLFHLGINMHALHSLGPQVEVVSGSRRTAVIYIASGFIATLASFLLCPAPSLGASGAVFGLGAALGVFFWRHREVLGPASETGLRTLGITVAINLAYSLVNKKIDNWGHTGGMLGGALLAYLLGPRFVFIPAEGGGRALQDLPPVRWLAFKPPPGGASIVLPLRRRAAGDGATRRKGPSGAEPDPQRPKGASGASGPGAVTGGDGDPTAASTAGGG